MPSAQLAEPRRQAPTVHPRPRPVDLSQESVSIDEAARFLKITEGHVAYLGDLGLMPNHKVNGEHRITIADLIAYRNEHERIIDNLQRSPLIQAMDTIYDQLGDEIYCKGHTELNTRLPQ